MKLVMDPEVRRILDQAHLLPPVHRAALAAAILESLDGTELDRAACVLGHHDFDVLPDGRYVFLRADFRDNVEGYDLPVVGDAVMIVDADGGNQRQRRI